MRPFTLNNHLRKFLLNCSNLKSIQSHQLKRFSTAQKHRLVRLENIKVNSLGQFPSLGKGVDYDVSIFGLILKPQHILDIQKATWGGDSFLPKRIAHSLNGCLGNLSEISEQMPVKLRDGTRGLLAQNKTRRAIDDLNQNLFEDFMGLLETFISSTSELEKTLLAHQLSDVCFEAQWLTRGYLFEGKLHGETYTADIVPTPLSQLLFASCYATGMQQVEFIYHNYTLLDGKLPAEDPLTVNVDNPQEILDYIASITARTGFNDVGGGNPEHNFRHNHTFMEAQMRLAFKGWDLVKEGKKEEGMNLVITAAERAHKIFKTMLSGTPAHPTTDKIGYADIRLPIAGVLGKAGSVYPPHGVAYDECGIDTFEIGNTKKYVAFVDDEWGQTGANSSMYKFFDAILGVTSKRGAFKTTPDYLGTIEKVLSKQMPSIELDKDPIVAMQSSFDFFTRPVNALQTLIDTNHSAESLSLHQDLTNNALNIQFLQLAYFVSAHRLVHGQYVKKAIYDTPPSGGQSRAQGTGGSTPEFLKKFLDQTHESIEDRLTALDQNWNQLSTDQQNIVQKIKNELTIHERNMGIIREQGLKIEQNEKETLVNNTNI